MSDDALLSLHRARAQRLIDLTDWKVRVYLALYERRLQHWEAAQVLLDEAMKRAPEDLDLLIVYGDNLARSGSAGAARGALERARSLAPDDPRIALASGWAELADGNVRGAAQLWRPITRYPTDESTLRRMRALFAQVRDAAAEQEVVHHMQDLEIAP